MHQFKTKASVLTNALHHADTVDLVSKLNTMSVVIPIDIKVQADLGIVNVRIHVTGIETKTQHIVKFLHDDSLKLSARVQTTSHDSLGLLDLANRTVEVLKSYLEVPIVRRRRHSERVRFRLRRIRQLPSSSHMKVIA